jgi:hypothetical protein
MAEVYFFGCHGGLGHYLYQPGRRYHIPNPGLPWINGELDGGLAPEGEDQALGVAALHYRAGWTAMSMWDRSLDRRFNSSATFIARGEHNFAAMTALASKHFYAVWERINAQAEVRELAGSFQAERRVG